LLIFPKKNFDFVLGILNTVLTIEWFLIMMNFYEIMVKKSESKIED